MLRRLLPAVFAQGIQTSDPVRDFGYAITPQHDPITAAAYRRIREWQQDWLALGTRVALTLTTGDTTITGAAVLSDLRVSVASEQALVAAAGTDAEPRMLVGQP